MAHDEQHRELSDRPGRVAVRATAVAVGLTLTAAAAVSVVYLSQRWQEAAPYREARAIEAANRRAVAEAARSAESAEFPRVAKDHENGVPSTASLPAGIEVGDVEVIAPSRSGSAAPTSGRAVESHPVRWLVQPRFRIPSEILMKQGPDRVSIGFECRVNRGGGLYGCTGTETPRGFGILPAARAALSEARVVPLTDNGRAVEGVVTFSHTWTRSRASSNSVEDRAPAGPAVVDVPAPVSLPADEPGALTKAQEAGNGTPGISLDENG